MNRDIKFRGKNTINGNFVEGYYYVDKGRHYIHTGHTIYPVHPYSVGQFTGFTDAGKSEIYEDDIIENDAINYRIEWSEYSGGWDCVDSEGNNISLSELASSNETWLQGNIHQNPELL